MLLQGRLGHQSRSPDAVRIQHHRVFFLGVISGRQDDSGCKLHPQFFIVNPKQPQGLLQQELGGMIPFLGDKYGEGSALPFRLGHAVYQSDG